MHRFTFDIWKWQGIKQSNYLLNVTKTHKLQ